MTDPGTPGADGQPGQDGQDGQSGSSAGTGIYYVPNAETGCFDKYQNGNFVEHTTISFVKNTDTPSNIITAVKTEEFLTLYGVEGGEAPLKSVSISLSGILKSMVFVPHLYLDGIEGVEYPWIGDTILRIYDLPDVWNNLSHHTSETGDKQDITIPNTLATDKGYDWVNNTLGRWYNYSTKQIEKKFIRSTSEADPNGARTYWRNPEWPTDEWIYGPAWEIEYHLNPSSAVVDYDVNAPSFNVLEPDVVYYNTRAAASTLGVTSPQEFYPLYDFSKKSGNNYARGAWRKGVGEPSPVVFRKDGTGILYAAIKIENPNKLAPWPTDETINPNGNTNSTDSYPAEQSGSNKPFAGDKTTETYGAQSWYGHTRYEYNKDNSDNTVALQMHKTEGDDMITSDYALIVPTHVQLEGLIWDKEPMYVEPKINEFKGGPNDPANKRGYTRIGDEEGWALDESVNCTANRIHIWDSPQEALADPDGAALELYAQDAAGLDLRPYIGVHYLRENLKKRETAPGVYNPKAYDVAVLHNGEEAAFGLHFEYELIDYIASTNSTRDSRYAAFKDWIGDTKEGDEVTGWNKTTDKSGIIIAQSVNAAGNTINTRSTTSTDKEPLVRVMLKNEKGDVLLDGYILIHINYTPLNLNIDNYPEYSHVFNLCDPITRTTTWSEFSKYILQDKLNGRFKIDAAVDNTGMEVLSFDDYYWAVCKESAAGTAVPTDDQKYVTPKAFAVDFPGVADAHQRGYQLELFNFGTDIYGNGGLPPTRGYADPETDNDFEAKELGTAVYFPNGEGPTNHIFSWSLSEEEIEYLTHDKKESEYPVKVTRWFAFVAKDEVRYREVNNYSAPYPYLWVKMTLNITRDMVTLKYKEKIDNYWFNYQTGEDKRNAALKKSKTDYSGVIFDIWAPGNIAKPTGIKGLGWDNYISSTMTADGVTNHFTLTKAEGTQNYCGHAKYYFAPKTYKITARTRIDGYRKSDKKDSEDWELAEYIITPQNGASVDDANGYHEAASRIPRKFPIPASLDSHPHDYRNADTWNMLFCKYVPEASKNTEINRNGAGLTHKVEKTKNIVANKWTNMYMNNSEWWSGHSAKTTANVLFTPNEVEYKTTPKGTHNGHKWDPAAANADIKKDADLKRYLQTCAIKYNDGVFNDTILYAKNVRTGEYTPIARFIQTEQYSRDQNTYQQAGYLELIHYLPIGATEADFRANKAVENLVCYDVLNALGYPMKADGTCNFDEARKFINKQMRAWVGVIANNGCDVALYVEQDQYDEWEAANDEEVWLSYWSGRGLSKYIAAPKDDHQYTPVATFLTSWERPINLRETEIQAAIDANTGENTIYLLDYLKLFDWRGDYSRQGYMYDGTPNHWWFWGYYNVKGIAIDMAPSSIWTNMHQADMNTYVKLSQVTTQARLYAGWPYMTQSEEIFGLGWHADGTRWEGTNGSIDASDWQLYNYATAAQESAIEVYMGIHPRNTTNLAKFGSFYYENNGDNVTEFDVIIPITIFYEWGSQKYYTKWHIDTTHGRTN